MKQSATESLVGRRIRCPSCDEFVLVPAPMEVGALVASGPEAQPQVSREKPLSVAPSLGDGFESLPDEEAPVEELALTKKSRICDGEMDMTPMVDVVFNLLI